MELWGQNMKYIVYQTRPVALFFVCYISLVDKGKHKMYLKGITRYLLYFTIKNTGKKMLEQYTQPCQNERTKNNYRAIR